MGSFSGLGVGLSFLFSCILMGLVAELYYLLWWKKRTASTDGNRGIEELSSLFCWRKSSSFNRPRSSQELTNSVRNPQGAEDLEMESGKDLGLKGYGGEEGMEIELMRMHNLGGPPRFLSTIKEESKEDLESDGGKSRKGSRTRSLSDLVFVADGTPLSSPTVKTPYSLDSYSHHGINPLFESPFEEEMNRLRSSPPPMFKFLKDAEDKLLRRLLLEEAERKRGAKNEDAVSSHNSKLGSEEGKSASSVSFISKSFERDQLHNQASSQVFPLASSPTCQTRT